MCKEEDYEQKAFIGYDLGDGETITDFSILSDNQIKESVQTVFVGMTMPDSNTPGQAIPTAYGFDQHTGKILFASSILSDPGAIHSICVNFKRRPSDLLDKDLLLHAPLLFKALQKNCPLKVSGPCCIQSLCVPLFARWLPLLTLFWRSCLSGICAKFGSGLRVHRLCGGPSHPVGRSGCGAV